jgi:ribonucleoside-diphosphate reductase alpha chain
LIKAAAARGKWIDQSQSLNIFFSGASGKELSDLYLYAWEMGLKTTYYLRSLAASQVEKSTMGESDTHMRSRDDNTIDKMPTTVVLEEEIIVLVENVTIPTAIPSPLMTPSPMTKETVEAARVTVAAGKVMPRLHIAEDALCEACQ